MGTPDFGINIGLRSLIFEKFEEKKWPQCLDWCKKSIKIVMWKFLGGGATVVPGATSIPESRVGAMNFKIL